jgi:flagellar motor switch protein FliN/FliY
MQEHPQTLSGDNKWLADLVASSLGESMEGMTGERPEVETVPAAAAPESSGEAVCWRVYALNGLKEGILWAGVPETTWRTVGARALKAAGIDDAPAEDFQATWHEIVTQAVSSTVQAIAKRLRREVSSEPPREVSGPKQPAAGVLLRWPLGGTPVWAYFFWNSALLESLDPASHPHAAAEPGKSAAASSASSSSAVEHSRTLDLLLEVQLPVSVSFGRTQLPLKDVLKLNSGSIVELNRGVSEPVEVIINNCVIARGEVVVVEGNYGVRIKQIISKEERLRTLY